MNWYFWLKWIHVLSSTVLFGTGLGIAFFFIRAQRTNNVVIIASVARDVVLADMVFTTTAVIIQPFSGMGLVLMGGYSLFSPWLLLSVAIYLIVGACWLRGVAANLDAGYGDRSNRDGEPVALRIQHPLSTVVCSGGGPHLSG